MTEPSAHDPSVPSDAAAQAGSFMTEDPCIHEQATEPWESVVTPLSGGKYRHAITFLSSPGLILYREGFWGRTRIKGLSPPGMFAFAVPLRVGSTTSWFDAPLHETGIPAMMPGGFHTDFSAGQQHLMVMIDLERFSKYLPPDLRNTIEAATRQHVLPATRDGVARFGATLNSLLDGVQADPQVLHHPHAVRSMEHDLMAAFRQSITLPTPAPRRVGCAIRQGGLNRALEYLRSTDNGSVTVADLCNVARVTQRTLEYAFRETFGISPLRFLHLRRYHAARRDLLAADGRTTTVTEIALKKGFYHMGRFAIRYKALFGESPSQTLERPSEKSDSYLLRRTGHGLS